MRRHVGGRGRLSPRGIILSGGPASVYEDGAPRLPDWVLRSGLPVLGICYGLQLLAVALGGKVQRAAAREYGLATVTVDEPGLLFAGLPGSLDVWMSHGDQVTDLPGSFRVLAHSENSPVAAVGDDARRLYGLQFHPEVVHTPLGAEIIGNFLSRVCGCTRELDAGLLRGRERGGHPRPGGRRQACCAGCPAASTARWWPRWWAEPSVTG